MSGKKNQTTPKAFPLLLIFNHCFKGVFEQASSTRRPETSALSPQEWEQPRNRIQFRSSGIASHKRRQTARIDGLAPAISLS